MNKKEFNKIVDEITNEFKKFDKILKNKLKELKYGK